MSLKEELIDEIKDYSIDKLAGLVAEGDITRDQAGEVLDLIYEGRLSVTSELLDEYKQQKQRDRLDNELFEEEIQEKAEEVDQS